MKRAAERIIGPKGGAWDVFIGLEVHAQIQLRSKLFSRSQAAAPSEHDEPNSRVSLFDASFPGTLPVLNASAVDQAVKAALALGSTVHRRSVFERKHYFYSDLPHGYQITQQRHPIATGGSLPLLFDPAGPKTTATTPKARGAAEARPADELQGGSSSNDPGLHVPAIGITRIQLEVDSGKSLHDRKGEGARRSLVDLNRAGTALMEIVFEPEIRSAAEAGAALRSLQLFLRRVGACDGNMEDGSMRCDLNVSVRPRGTEALGERVEVKNMNSVRHLMTAAAAEAVRQARQLEMGEGPIERETRGFDVSKGETIHLRRKEGSVDYRFFPEPDLPPLVVTDEHVEALRATLPELPEATMARLSADYGLAEHLSRLIVCAAGGASEYFEDLVNDASRERGHGQAASEGGGPYRRDPRVAANWLSNNLFGLLKDQLGSGDGDERGLERRFPAERLGGLLDLLSDGTVSSQTAKSVLREMVLEDHSSTALEIIEAKDLRQMTDQAEIESLCRGIVQDPRHAKQLASYRSGKTNLSKFFMGQAFKATRGRVDGKVVETCVMKLLQQPEPPAANPSHSRLD
ncbi:unnamed protein product [Ectocarpus fasciculatus]